MRADTLSLRRELGGSVVERLKAEIPGISAHVGEDYADSDEPEAVLYRRIGAHFRWVAFTFAPWRSWDLHVGVVEIEPGVLSIGFHISERAKDVMLERLRDLGARIGAKPVHCPAAIEYQANLPPFDLARADKASLTDTIIRLCRDYAPVAARATPPM